MWKNSRILSFQGISTNFNSCSLSSWDIWGKITSKIWMWYRYTCFLPWTSFYSTVRCVFRHEELGIALYCLLISSKIPKWFSNAADAHSEYHPEYFTSFLQIFSVSFAWKCVLDFSDKHIPRLRRWWCFSVVIIIHRQLLTISSKLPHTIFIK
jgi:hypothetical protein